jgi:glutamine amidotransferase
LRETQLGEFSQRGGRLADNPDGWGIAWREGGRFQLHKEPVPGCDSGRFAGLIEQLRSDLVIAHVRKAKWPPINTLNNTHPFLHDCCGRRWAFAHNGLVPEIVPLEAANRKRVCQPAGETDSEFAFCHLLSHVSQFEQEADHPADHASDWLALLGSISEGIARHGKFNFLLSDGEYLIAYGHDRLHYRESDAGGVLIATEPLGEVSSWLPFAPDELRIYHAGRYIPLGREFATNSSR